MLQTSPRLLEARGLTMHAQAVREAHPRTPEAPMDLQDVGRLCGLEAGLSAFRALPPDQQHDGGLVARAFAISVAWRACRYWAMERPADTFWRTCLDVGESFLAQQVGAPTMARYFEKLGEYADELVRMNNRKGRELVGRTASLVCAVHSVHWALAPNILYDCYTAAIEALDAAANWPCDHRPVDSTHLVTMDVSWSVAMRRAEANVHLEIFVLQTAHEPEPIPI